MEPTTQTQPQQNVPEQVPQKHFPWIVVILSVLVVISTMSAIYFYRLYKDTVSMVEQEAISSVQETPANNQPENVLRGVDIKNIRVGDTFDKLRVNRVGYTTWPPGDSTGSLESAHISFTGPITVSGKVWWDQMFEQACMNVDLQDEHKIPRLKEDNGTAWFCFSNPVDSLPRAMQDKTKTTPQEGVFMTVEIDAYQVNWAPKEVSDTAQFVRLAPQG